MNIKKEYEALKKINANLETQLEHANSLLEERESLKEELPRDLIQHL